MKNLRKEKTTKAIAARLAVLFITLAMLFTSMPFGLLTYANEAEDAQAATEQSTDAASQTQTEPKDKAEEEPKQDSKEESKKGEPKNNAPKEDAKNATKDNAENEDPDKGVLEVSSPVGSYTVDFYFTAEDGTETEYHLKGGTSIMLSELFEKLGIDRNTADIKETVFTDNELVRFEKVGDDYKVISLKPFNTEESLTITFEDDEVIVLRVEDATAWNNVTWEIDSQGTLTIKPTNPSQTAKISRSVRDNTSNFARKDDWPWNTQRNDIKKVVIQSEIDAWGNTDLKYMFADCKNLTEVDLSGLKKGNFRNLDYMFYGCSNLVKVTGLDKLGSSSSATMGYMFQNCSKLTTLTGIGNMTVTNVEQMQRMFSGCKSLTQLDLSGWKNPGKVHNMNNMFRESGLTTITMPGSEFQTRNDSLMESMFQDCTSLTNVNFGTADNHMDVTKAKIMTNMFKGCTALETLDVSTFGELTNIVNMDGFVNGCTKLKTLNIDNLDNSRIGPTSNRGHTSSDPDASTTGASDFGRMLDIHTCTALETLSAKDSNVWMCFNNRGTPSKEYYLAANENETYYFTDKEMKFVPDAKPTVTVTIDSNRDYIDLITDRDGTNVPKTTPVQNPLPDASTNINIVNGDLNTNGAGKLAPGVYTITKNARKEPAEPDMCDTYYRIAYIGEVPYKVEGITSNDSDLVMVEGSANTYINTRNRAWTETENYTIDRTTKPIKVIYENAAIDMNGRRYDVVITITKITFKEVGRVPTEPVSRVPHDENDYVPTNRMYYRPILQANKSDGLQFHNYVWTGEPTEPWNKTNCLSKGSGTDIEFTISIDGAPNDTSFVFKGEDLDVPYGQSWHNSTRDACLDYLPVKDNLYNDDGEGFDLLSGNVLSTLQFSEHTGLVLVDDNHVMSTGSDPDTTWSEFTVKADAQGSNYRWTSGISCTSYALRNTKAQNAGKISLQPKVVKELINGTLGADQFKFELKQVAKDPQSAPNPTNNDQTKTNATDGTVTFDLMKFGENEEYFPGADSRTGEHNTYKYTYSVKEIIPDDAETVGSYKVKDGIIYDTSEHTVTIVIKTPENETEMIRGIKAEIYVDKTPGEGVSPDKTYWHREKACVDCSNGTPTEIEADKWYDEDGVEIQDPNPIPLSKLEFKNKKIDPVELKIPVQKILQGRSWKDTDEFAAGLVLVTNDAPMPDNPQIIGDGRKLSEVVINNEDTPVKNDDDKIIGYKDTFKPITYTLNDLGKTYEYDVRELMPSESSAAPIPGVTYDTGEYNVKVKITLDETDPDDPKLVATAEYKGKDGEVTISSFTNIYDAEETDYKMEAVKDFWDVSKEEEIQLEAGEFTFAVKPIGENAAIAPMPAGYEGSGADRRYYKTNERDGDIEFEGDPGQIKDGMVFNYKALLDAGVDDAALHSDKGVDFEYVIYEIIPGTKEGIAKGKKLSSKETLVNNEDGTYSVIGDDEETVYDGVHHTRKITVKVIQGDAMATGETVTIEGQSYAVYKDFKKVEYYEKDGKAYKRSDNTLYAPDLETLDVEGHPDDHKACYYISEKGGKTEEVPMSKVAGYDPTRHHFKVNEHGEPVQGAPIFINYRFDQKYVDLKVKKVWDDGNDSDKIRPKSITMTITSDEGDYKPKDLVVKGSSWTASEKLPVWEFDIKTEKLKKITYSVKEAKVPKGYIATYSPSPSSITLDPTTGEYNMTVTNKHVPEKDPGDDDVRGTNTGDRNNMAIWIALLAAAVVAVVAVIIRRRRRDG